MPSFRVVLAALAAAPLALTAQAKYTLSDSFQGSSFFDTFDFFTAADPTDGFVKYVDFESAKSNQLIGVVTGTGEEPSVYLGTDFSSVTTTGRDSVRVQSQQAWTHGLLVADVQSIPSGCGTWPALWMLSHSPEWPGVTGEIDIIETVNNRVSNAMTLHTDAGCAVTNSSTSFSGTMSTSDCDVKDSNQSTNAGCSILAPINDTITMDGQSCTHSTAGPDFNKQGGGVYVMLWESDALTFWFYPRGYIPVDITSNNPDPSSWTTKPVAHFAGCAFDEHLSNLSVTIDMTFCGQWAGDAFASDGCATSTGVSTCNAYVGQNPEAFSNAYWLFNSIKMYQNSSDVSHTKTKRDTELSKRSLLIPTIDLDERSAPVFDFDNRSAPVFERKLRPAPVYSSGAISLKAGIEQEGSFATRGFAIFGVLLAIFVALIV